MSVASRPRNWYDMSYEQQREWERNERKHRDELDDAERREREARDEAEMLDRRRRRELASAREELSGYVEESERLADEVNQLRVERDGLVAAARRLLDITACFGDGADGCDCPYHALLMMVGEASS